MVSIVLTPEQVVSVLAQNGGAAPPVIPPAPPAPPSPPAPPAPPAPPGGNIINLSGDWSNPGRTPTAMAGADVVVYAFTTGDKDSTSDNMPRISGAEWQGPPSERYAVLSKSPNDFSHQGWAGGVSAGNTIQIPFAVGPDNKWSAFYPSLEKNTTYYLNVRNARPENQDSFSMFIELSVPGYLR